MHVMTLYANRWGGQRYRTVELAKFLNRHLYNIQEEALVRRKRVSLDLAYDAFLSSDHTPIYAKSIQATAAKRAWRIKDELGFETIFAEGTEILLFEDGAIKFKKIEDIKPGDLRIINFEKVEPLRNDKSNHHLAFTENFISIKCPPEERQMIMCDGINAMMILKNVDGGVDKIDQFDSKSVQEIYVIKIIEVTEVEPRNFFEIDFHEFSYSLSKNRALSNKSGNRYYNYRKATLTKRWLEKMRSKVFRMKKDKVDFQMELTKKCE